MTDDRALGVDVCPSGWVGISLDHDGVRGWFAPTIGALVEQVTDGATPLVVAIDIPIGLPVDGMREADRLARAFLGPRRSSVFTTLVRSAYEATDFQAANRAQHAATGAGTSRQGWGLRHKVLEVDRWLDDGGAADDAIDVVECHPEVSFTAMNHDTPVRTAKKTWAGQHQRIALLATQGIVIPNELGEAGRRAGVDDVLDAAAAAWTARRVATGTATQLPEVPERLGDRRAAIAY